jgi:hypothetical protein
MSHVTDIFECHTRCHQFACHQDVYKEYINNHAKAMTDLELFVASSKVTNNKLFIHWPQSPTYTHYVAKDMCTAADAGLSTAQHTGL